MEKISIGILTYHRESGLRRLLDSIARSGPLDVLQDILICHTAPGDPDLRQRIQTDYAHLPILWIAAENRWSIAEGRNALLERATSEHLLFLDDDQRLPADSLGRLVACLADQACSTSVLRLKVVFQFETPGNRIARFIARYHDQKMKRWLKTTAAFPRLPGSWVATNGVVIPLHHPHIRNLRFSTETAHMGGEDNLFFQTAEARGIKCLYLPQVEVEEWYPAQRTTLRDWTRRTFREGLCYGLLHLRPAVSWQTRCFFFLRAFVGLWLGLLWMLATFWLPPFHGLPGWHLLARQSGKWAALFGNRFAYYK